MNRYAFLGLLTVGFVALMAPRLDAVDEGGAQVETLVAGSNQVANLEGNPDQSWYSGGHALQRGSNGHFFADGYVDGASVHFMVDTGASVIALTGRDAEAIGLQWDPSEVRMVGTGASGAVYGVNARLAQVEVGGMTERNVDAVIIPEGLEVSLLGQSYLSRLSNVSIMGDQMVLGGGN